MKEKWTGRTALFLAGQTVTIFGSAIVQFAISWHITLSTKSGMMLTVATLCGFLPQVLVSLFAGVWADRYNRKTLIIAADSMIAVCTAVLAVLFSSGHTEIWLLFLIAAVRSVGSGIQAPAVDAFLTELVPAERLMKVNGIKSSLMSLMMLLAPAVAGALYASFGLGPVFWVDVATAAVGILLLSLLKTPKRALPEAKENTGIFADMSVGFKYVAKTKWLTQIMGFYLVYALMFGPVVFLTPLMVARSFGEEPWRLVWHEIVFSIGSMAGGLLAGLWGGFKNRVHTFILASAAFGLTTFIMGFSKSFPFYLGVMLAMGMAMPFINTNAITLLQTRTDPAMIGRVFGLVSIIGSGATPLSMAIFGPLADTVSVETQLIITGALMTVIALLSFFLKDMVAIGRPVEAVLEQP